MAIFGPKPWVNFSKFSTSCFQSLERRFFVLEYCKRHFPGIQCLKKKKVGKMAIFGPKLWVNFSTFSTSCFYSLEKPFFVLEYCKRHFRGLSCLKKKVSKMAIFPRKPWVIPFENMPIFRLFELFDFIAQKGVFSFQNIVKDIFLAYSAQKKKFEKWPFFDENHGLSPLEKNSIFRRFKLLVFIAQKGAYPL